jgi:hypothetical protein
MSFPTDSNLIKLFKLIKSKSPLYLYRKLSSSKSTRTQNLNILENTVWARSKFLFVRGVGWWNALILSIRCQGNAENFKRCYWKGLSHLWIFLGFWDTKNYLKLSSMSLTFSRFSQFPSSNLDVFINHFLLKPVDQTIHSQNPVH